MTAHTSKQDLMKYLCLLWMVFSGSMLAACMTASPDNPTDSPLPSSSSTIQHTQTTSSLLTPTPTGVPSAAPTPNPALSKIGPWVVFTSHPNDPGPNAGLWVFNRDATGAAHLVTGNITHFQLEQNISPNGRNIAVATTTDSITGEGLTLHILDVPAQREVAAIPLISPQNMPAADGSAAESLYATAFALSIAGVAWSPDGNQLAFAAATEGVTADMYVYSVDTNTVHRISAEDSNALGPVWSPGPGAAGDGGYLAYHVQQHFGVSTGRDGDALWLTHVTDAKARLLYEPSPGGEEILGWIDAHTLLVTSWLDNCGRHGLRAIHVKTGEQRMLWDDNFTEIVQVPSRNELLIAAGEIYAHCGPTTSRRGVYLMSLETGEARQIAASSAHQVWTTGSQIAPVWLPDIAQFLINTDDGQVLLVSPTGESKSLPVEEGLFPVVSPDGSMTAWFGPDDGPGKLLITSTGQAEGRLVYDQPVSQVLWGENSSTLFFLGRNAVYVLPQPDGAPIPVVTDVMPWHMAWMKPPE